METSLGKNVLVSGASGFIGANLVRELLKRKFRVRVIIKPGDSASNIKDLITSKKVETVVADLRSKKSLKNVAEGIDVIFHLAAKTDLSTKNYKPYYENNFLATKNLVEVCKKVKCFIHYSSILTVGLPNTKEPLDEDYQGSADTYYGRSKKKTEDYLLNKHRRDHFPVIILRPSTVYGPYETLVQYQLFKVIKENKFFMIGSGNNLISYLFVGNLVDITINAINQKEALGKIFFINDARAYKYSDVVRTIYKVMNKNMPSFKMPFVIAIIGAYFYSKLCQLIKIKPLIYPSRVKTMVLNYVYSISKAKKILKYRPKDNLYDGVQITYNWYKERGML